MQESVYPVSGIPINASISTMVVVPPHRHQAGSLWLPVQNGYFRIKNVLCFHRGCAHRRARHPWREHTGDLIHETSCFNGGCDSTNTDVLVGNNRGTPKKIPASYLLPRQTGMCKQGTANSVLAREFPLLCIPMLFLISTICVSSLFRKQVGSL